MTPNHTLLTSRLRLRMIHADESERFVDAIQSSPLSTRGLTGVIQHLPLKKQQTF